MYDNKSLKSINPFNLESQKKLFSKETNYLLKYIVFSEQLRQLKTWKKTIKYPGQNHLKII